MLDRAATEIEALSAPKALPDHGRDRLPRGRCQRICCSEAGDACVSGLRRSCARPSCLHASMSRRTATYPTEHARTAPPRASGSPSSPLTALGVVYGDIGTSPLYALRECFKAGVRHHADAGRTCSACCR